MADDNSKIFTDISAEFLGVICEEIEENIDEHTNTGVDADIAKMPKDSKENADITDVSDGYKAEMKNPNRNK